MKRPRSQQPRRLGRWATTEAAKTDSKYVKTAAAQRAFDLLIFVRGSSFDRSLARLREYGIQVVLDCGEEECSATLLRFSSDIEPREELARGVSTSAQHPTAALERALERLIQKENQPHVEPERAPRPDGARRRAQRR